MYTVLDDALSHKHLIKACRAVIEAALLGWESAIVTEYRTFITGFKRN